LETTHTAWFVGRKVNILTKEEIEIDREMEKLEATLRGKIKESEKECTDAEATKKREKKLKGLNSTGSTRKLPSLAKLKNPTTSS